MLVCLASWAWLGAAWGQDACESWPGEIAPLPTTQSEDRFEARWAELRARELAVLAQALEQARPSDAYRLWAHVRCLNPEAPEAAARMPDLAPTLAYKTRPFVIVAKPTPPPSAVPPSFSAVDEQIAAAEREISEARFREALEYTERARELLAEQKSESGRVRLAKVEVVRATALVALGRSEDAGDSFVRALAADPDLELDESTTPPKIRRLFGQIRDQAAQSAAGSTP